MKPLSRCLLVVATLGLVTVSTPALAAEEAPPLWTGTIESPSGAEAAAEVTAYLEPPVDRLPGEEEVQLTPIASTTAGRNGRFTLRASYDDRIRAAEDRAGWISVLVVGMTADGMSMATDSVRYDHGRRRWSTHPAEAEPDGPIEAQGIASVAGVPDRPAVMTLHHSPAPTEPRFRAMAARHRICYMKKGARPNDVGVTPVTVGELDLDQNWGGQFNYTDTRTSTFEVGFKYEHEGVWSAGGTASFSKDGSSESINPVDPAGHYRHHLYRADMMFRTFRMECGGRTGWALKPTMWTGGMRTESTRLMACTIRFKVPVPAGSTFVREDGSSQSFSAAFSILGFSAGRSQSTPTRCVTPGRIGTPAPGLFAESRISHRTTPGSSRSRYEIPAPTRCRSACRRVFRRQRRRPGRWAPDRVAAGRDRNSGRGRSGGDCRLHVAFQPR